MELTIKEYAERERVTQRTVYNWLHKGAVEYRRTPGGAIRIAEPPTAAAKISENSRNPSK